MADQALDRKKGFVITFLILTVVHSWAQDLNMTLLPASINSKATEYAPSLSADGNTMVFESNRDGQYKLYISRKEKGDWSKAIPIDGINNFDKGSALIGGPSLSYDGNQIYFFSFFSKGFGLEDIYFSNRTSTGWGSPINAGKMINTRDYEGFPTISSDGNKLYFLRKKHNVDNPKIFCTKIMVSEKDVAGNWMLPKELPPPINMHCEKCPRILSDNETLIFASNRLNKATTMNDLFMSRLSPDKSWSDPVPIAPLNTPEDDQFATISSKGDLVYFINNKSGNYDIYSSILPEEFRPRKVTDVQGMVTNNRQEPVTATILIYANGVLKNTGGLVSNESDGAFGYTLTHGYTYEIITRAPGHSPDTFRINLSTATEYGLQKRNVILKERTDVLVLKTENELTHTLIRASMKKEGTKEIEEQEVAGQFSMNVRYGDAFKLTISRPGFSSKVFSFNYDADSVGLVQTIALKPTLPTLFLQAVDGDTKTPLVPDFEFIEGRNPTPLFRSKLPAPGWKQTLKYDKVYRMKMRMRGYFSFQDTINLAGVFEGRALNKIIPMTPLKVGNKLSLNSVYFATNSADLSDDSKPVLDEVAYVLRQNGNVVVEIGAHSDDVGNDNSNLVLSQKRADAVRNYLLTVGVSPGAMSPKGYGEGVPLVPNDSDANRALNRRVEFAILRVR